MEIFRTESPLNNVQKCAICIKLYNNFILHSETNFKDIQKCLFRVLTCIFLDLPDGILFFFPSELRFD